MLWKEEGFRIALYGEILYNKNVSLLLVNVKQILKFKFLATWFNFPNLCCTYVSGGDAGNTVRGTMTSSLPLLYFYHNSLSLPSIAKQI